MTRAPGRWPQRRAVLAVGGLVAAGVAWLVLGHEGDYALTAACDPAGLVAGLRASTRPRVFWEDQVLAADSRIAFLTRPPPDLGAVDAQIAKSIHESEAMMERTYRDHPEMRPSKASIAAQALRDQADRIEEEEMKANFEAMVKTSVTTQVMELNSCKPIAASRAAAAQ